MFDHSIPTCTLSFFLGGWGEGGSGDYLVHTNSTLYARISPQWLSKLRQLWLNVPWQVVCKLIFGKVPTLCLDSGIVSPLQLHWVMGVCVFRYNLHFWQNDQGQGLLHATVVTWGGGWGGSRVERTPNNSQHTKLTLEKKILLPGFKLPTFWSEVLCSYQQAIPAWLWSSITLMRVLITTETETSGKLQLCCIKYLFKKHFYLTHMRKVFDKGSSYMETWKVEFKK